MRIANNERELEKKREEEHNLMRAIVHLHDDPKVVVEQVRSGLHTEMRDACTLARAPADANGFAGDCLAG